MRLQDIAKRLDCELLGDGSIEIHRVSGLEDAQAGDLTFLSNPKYQRLVYTTRASAIILSHEFPDPPLPALRTDNPYLAFAKSVDLFYSPPEPQPGIHPTAIIARSVSLGRKPRIGAYCVVGDNVRIGNNVTLHPHVIIYPGVQIGDQFVAHAHVCIREYTLLGNRVTVQNGAVIGADGFGFAKTLDGHYQKITQSGRVIIEDDVEIQANSTIDRAAIGETRIGRGSKLDNLVQVGHGSRVGQSSLLCAQVGLAGSTQVGSNVILTGQVGVAGHCKIGDNVIATAQTGIPGDVEPNRVVSGYPAVDNRLWLKCTSIFNRLPELNRKIRSIRVELENLKKRRIDSTSEEAEHDA